MNCKKCDEENEVHASSYNGVSEVNMHRQIMFRTGLFIRRYAASLDCSLRIVMLSILLSVIGVLISRWLKTAE